MSQEVDTSKPHHLTNFEAIQVFYERSQFRKFDEFEFSFLNYFAKTRLVSIPNDAMEQARILLEPYSFTTEEKVQILNFFPVTVDELTPLVQNWQQRFTPEELDHVASSLSKLYPQGSDEEEEEQET